MDFLSLCDKVESIVRVNWRGVNVYLKPIYKYYFGLFQKMIMPMVEKIWTDNTLPELVVRMKLLKIYLYMCVYALLEVDVLHPLLHASHIYNAFGQRKLPSRLQMNLIIYFDLIIRNDA